MLNYVLCETQIDYAYETMSSINYKITLFDNLYRVEYILWIGPYFPDISFSFPKYQLNSICYQKLLSRLKIIYSGAKVDEKNL